MKNFFEELTLALGAAFLGIVVGFFVGIVCWVKFPFVIYRTARVKMALKRIQEAEEYLERNGQGARSKDIWARHIERIEQKKNYDN